MKRRTAVLLYITVISICAAVVATVVHPPLIATIAILCLSIIAFNFLAFWTYDANLWWRFVDYPWVLATVATLTLAVTNIGNSVSNAERKEFDLISRSLHDSRIFEDLREWNGSCRFMGDHAPVRMSKRIVSESNKFGEQEIDFKPCLTDKLQAFLRAMEDGRHSDSFPNDILVDQIDDVEKWDYFCKTQQDQVTNSIWASMPSGPDQVDIADANLKGFHDFCESFSSLHLEGPLENLVELRRVGSSSTLAWTLEEPWQLRWWYFIYAFMVGLRVGKITAEITQLRKRR